MNGGSTPVNEAVRRPVPERLTFRFDDLPDALGVSRRTIERARAAGRFPKPDLHIGRMPLWRKATIEDWIDGGGHK
jgi:predicted DNA-binding transcriptional regulator AlpA